MSEKDLQAAVIDLARVQGWICAHFRPALTKQGWRTPVSADGAGFPDCLFVRGDRVVVAELKAKPGRLTPEQMRWLDAFDLAGVETWLWRPSHWHDGTILRVLQR
jgi:hypothetical protein